ncbi:hypothetical protein FALCPG4_006570 [Fusarium falciforme]
MLKTGGWTGNVSWGRFRLKSHCRTEYRVECRWPWPYSWYSTVPSPASSIPIFFPASMMLPRRFSLLPSLRPRWLRAHHVFHAELPPSMTASSRLDGGNLGKTEDGMDGWMGREDLDSQEPQDAIASAMVQKRMRVVCRYETLGQKLDQKYLFPTGTSSIPPEERPARWSTSPSMLARAC